MSDLRGKPVADHIVEKAKVDIAKLKEQGINPKLAVIRVGARPDDLAYERGILKRFGDAGCDYQVYELNGDCTQEELNDQFDKCNKDDSIHGILMFRPLPKNLSDEYIRNNINPRKDIDAMGLINQAALFAGDKRAFAPCTAQAVIEILRHYNVSLRGKKVTVVGRSLVIGKPVSLLLIGEDATVTVCHTKTKDLKAELQRADIIVAAAGKASIIKAEHVHEGQVIIDVGMDTDDEGKLCGDVDYANVAPIVDSITPVPGGVGAVTTSVLLKYTVASAQRFADGEV